MTYYLEGNNDSNGFGFLIRNYTDKRKRNSIFEVLKEKNYQPRIPYLAKIFPEIKVK